jgi:outer membrane protein assembly factor BamB
MSHSTASLLALLCSCSPLLALDWLQYLGPNGDNTTSELIRTNWSAQPPQELWRRSIGPGFGSMSVRGETVFTLLRRSAQGTDHEWCVALNANTGAELWAAELEIADYTQLSGYSQDMDGPRSTPTIDSDRVYVLTSHLKLVCLRADNGDRVWSRDFPSELGSDVIAWENSASPLLVGDMIFLNCNASGRRLLAVRKSDGSTVWSGQDDEMTHATPIFAKVADTRQVIFLTHDGLVSVVPEDGTVLWRLGFSPSSTSTAASPTVAGDRVWASAAYGSGAWAAKVAKTGSKWTAAQAWHQQGNAYQSHWSTPVLHNGFLYCIASPSSSQARLTCLDVSAGTNRWFQTKVGSDNIGFGSLIRTGDLLVVLTEAGELVLVKPDPAGYVEVARRKILDAYCWNHVTLANGRIYARSTSASAEMVAVDVSLPTAAIPPFGVSAARSEAGAGLKLILRSVDGSSLDSGQAAQLQLLSTTNLALPVGQWSVVAQSFADTNGSWTAVVPFSSQPQQFLGVRKKEGQ